MDKSDEKLFLEIYFCTLRLEQGSRKVHDFIFWGKEIQRDFPVKDMLILNNSQYG